MSRETPNNGHFGLFLHGLFEADVRERTEHVLTPLAQTFVDAVRASMDEFIEGYPAAKEICRAQRGHLSLNVQDTDLAPYEKDRMLPNKCVGAGRIKRAGKPVFYGAEDEKTAVMECRPCRGEVLSVATLRTNQDRRILDLSRKSFVGKESTTCFCSKSRSYI